MALAYDRQGSGEPLVLLHGTGSQRQIWDPVLARLAAQRDVVVPDLPGFGDSPVLPGGRAPTPTALAAAVVELLDGLGLAQPHLAGNSLGGWVALELARAGRARSVCALSPSGFWSPRELTYARAVLRASRASALRLLPAAPVLVATAAGRSALFGHMTAHPARMPAAAALEAVRNLATCPGWEATLRETAAGRFSRGAEIDVPVTVAWAEHDRLLLPRQGARAARALPQARVVLLRGCGHVPTYDDPGQVATVLLRAGGA